MHLSMRYGERGKWSSILWAFLRDQCIIFDTYCQVTVKAFKSWSCFNSQVDAIVNSTNRVLKLDDGFVSKLILKHGGWKIQEDLTTQYKDGIGHGDVAVSIPGKLKCRGIIHCVLLDWISVGNLSCKVNNLKPSNVGRIFYMKPKGTVSFYAYTSIPPQKKMVLINYPKKSMLFSCEL